MVIQDRLRLPGKGYGRRGWAERKAPASLLADLLEVSLVLRRLTLADRKGGRRYRSRCSKSDSGPKESPVRNTFVLVAQQVMLCSCGVSW
jgi:hypothetical protein